MDSLISALHNFQVTDNKDSFQDSLDLIINQFDSLTHTDSDSHWELFRLNYSKMLYIQGLIKVIDFTEIDNFEKCIGSFMNYLDIQTQSYLKQIIWDFENYGEQNIKQLFEESLNLNKPLVRFHTLLTGYELMLTLIEEARGEKFTEILMDTSFVNDFNFKKRKII